MACAIQNQTKWTSDFFSSYSKIRSIRADISENRISLNPAHAHTELEAAINLCAIPGYIYKPALPKYFSPRNLFGKNNWSQLFMPIWDKRSYLHFLWNTMSKFHPALILALLAGHQGSYLPTSMTAFYHLPIVCDIILLSANIESIWIPPWTLAWKSGGGKRGPFQ